MTTEPLDLDTIQEVHGHHHKTPLGTCCLCGIEDPPCDAYRLAAELAEAQERVARMKTLRETLVTEHRRGVDLISISRTVDRIDAALAEPVQEKP